MKDKDELENRQGAVLKIKCYAFYYGESGRNLPKHERATGKGDVNNHIAEDHGRTNHTIDWDSAQRLTYNTSYF